MCRCTSDKFFVNAFNLIALYIRCGVCELIGGATGHCRDSSPAAVEVSGLPRLRHDAMYHLPGLRSSVTPTQFRSSFCQRATFNSFGHLVSAPHAAITVRVSKGTFEALARGSAPRDRIVWAHGRTGRLTPHRPQDSQQTLRLALRCVRLVCGCDSVCMYVRAIISSSPQLLRKACNCWCLVNRRPKFQVRQVA